MSLYRIPFLKDCTNSHLKYLFSSLTEKSPAIVSIFFVPTKLWYISLTYSLSAFFANSSLTYSLSAFFANSSLTYSLSAFFANSSLTYSLSAFFANSSLTNDISALRSKHSETHPVSALVLRIFDVRS
ncbi:hypothetical protein TVAG_524130 [Trichomonas vaginalis G3]|uniref:Uncharacterized protein n=1 Tax=Trichomonas vaginalis (strain ATCC PRA-98 / G3) TaxID=412133 RepID=A2HU89_TRIV3|nr:hypothetical protein TVAG_524130 [Trichomonas vaginalis G3]|eukprot:XP_001279958.1 hypothetical protein [Trichomonas vaginalis G3]